MYVRPTDEEIEKLEAKVAKFKKDNNINYSVQCDISKICRDLGFDVVTMTTENNEDEVLDGVILLDGNEKIIGVSDRVNIQDARFIIAHELGHYISENGKVSYAFRDKHITGISQNKEENNIDYIAAAILVPRDIFRLFLKTLGIKKIRDMSVLKSTVPDVYINELSRIFNVSRDVIERRIVEVSE